MCECYTVGGRFIAEDPECPQHGWAAQRQEKIDAEEQEQAEERIAALEARVHAMEVTLARLTQNPNA